MRPHRRLYFIPTGLFSTWYLLPPRWVIFMLALLFTISMMSSRLGLPYESRHFHRIGFTPVSHGDFR